MVNWREPHEAESKNEAKEKRGLEKQRMEQEKPLRELKTMVK